MFKDKNNIKPSNHTIKIIQADITTLAIDAIVNAANNSLQGGGGVDGAIHRKAGRALTDYCRQLNGCPTGEAKITPAFNLPCQYVIHTVGPIWQGGQANEATLLTNCYQNALKLADKHQITSLAFPAISTGIYGYPLQPATQIAISTVLNHLQSSSSSQISSLQEVIFCCFSQKDKQVYEMVYQQITCQP